MQENELNYSENSTQGKKRRGRPTDPNALKFRSVGLNAAGWAYVMQWASENDPENPTAALTNCLDELRRMAVGPGFSSSRPRDEKGRWLPDGNR